MVVELGPEVLSGPSVVPTDASEDKLDAQHSLPNGNNDHPPPNGTPVALQVNGFSRHSSSSSNRRQTQVINGHLTNSPRQNGRAQLSSETSTTDGLGVPKRSNGMGGVNGSMRSLVSVQQPDEEADSYHVRSTYARLEVEGVYGDGWDEGLERTRERAILGKRKSMIPLGRGDALAPEERKVLAQVDRYGFFDQELKTRSESRLALLPNTPLSKIPKLPSQPPTRSKVVPTPTSMFAPTGGSAEEPAALQPGETAKLSQRAMGKMRQKEAERVDKWERMLVVGSRDSGGNVSEWKWTAEAGGSKQLTKRIYKGIPDRWRGAAWATMAGLRTKDKERSDRRQVYRAPDFAQNYRAGLDTSSSYDVQIDLDVPRTISGHVQFHTRYGQGQRSLFHVLHSFSLYCSTCGYCQGMGPIAVTLLSYFEPIQAFGLMVRIHDVYQMHTIFEPGFPGLLEGFYVQERLIEYLMPEVFSSFQKHMISSSSYATKWYITLFANTVPFQTQLRIWDALFLEGRDLLVMVSVAIIWTFKSALSSPNANFETILNCLSSFFVPEDEDTFLRWVRKMMNAPGVKERMAGWRVEWESVKDTPNALL